MGPAYDDIERIEPMTDNAVAVRLRRPSPFLVEALETLINKPGTADGGTGPYRPTSTSGSAVDMKAFDAHYLGRPVIDEVRFQPYPSIRAAWAEMLRGNVDWLFEVGVDALDSLKTATNVSVFSFVRNYQYLVMFGSKMNKSSAVRRALNAGINREMLVTRALNGYGVPSYGPVSPRHWAVRPSTPTLTFDPEIAGELVHSKLRFTCLVPADSVYERVALELKRQLAEVSVDLILEEASQERLSQSFNDGDFETLLADPISGPTLFRSYLFWHSHGTRHTPGTGNPGMDAALDRIRHAASDDEYRTGVEAFQRATVENPPAIFLAWSERARAVSRRFTVPAEPGRDILPTIQFWRPVTDQRYASRN